ncbi:MAG: hypothetical protein QGF34_04360 [Candidatus Poseidoniaceae archaeon]|nr:hypothetical protein [Candidatus Poseidoniaceae archaeon]
MRNNRTTIRSLVTTQGTFLAMSDGMIVWETTAARKTLHLRTAATALLGVKEDNKSLSKLFVGDRLGQLHVIQLPTFALEYTTNVSDAAMRAMCINGDGALMVADAKGNIWNIDSKGNSELMFATNRSISSIRVEGKSIRIQSGWEQCLYNLNGDLANSKNASHSFGENLMLRRMRERKKLEVQRREAEAQLRLLPSA